MSSEIWDERYSHPNYFYGYKPNDFLKAQARLLKPGSRVLCLGDGEGRNGVWLAGLGHDVVSLDFSRVALDKAEALAGEKGVAIETWHADLAEWVDHPDPERPWDAVVAIFLHLPADLRRRVAEVVTRQSAPGAKLSLGRTRQPSVALWHRWAEGPCPADEPCRRRRGLAGLAPGRPSGGAADLRRQGHRRVTEVRWCRPSA